MTPAAPYPIPHTLYPKKGISLITVLMFMLAATIASTVLFRYLGSENLASGSRLKQSEAFQASESGLDAVRGWLSNRAGDAAALATFYDTMTVKRPILLTATDPNESGKNYINVLGAIGGQRNQQFKVYLTGIDKRTIGAPIKMKFLSVGTARDGSQASQTAIFSVNGLYKITIPSVFKRRKSDYNQAFYGTITGNTQAKWSSAIINGDMNMGNGVETKGKVLVTGSLIGDQYSTCQDNAKCLSENNGKSEAEIESLCRSNDVYIAGNLNVTRFDVCGSVYVGGVVGGNKISGNTWTVANDFYAFGGVTYNRSPQLIVGGNFSSCGTVSLGNYGPFTVAGNFVLEENCVVKQNFLEYRTSSGQLNIAQNASDKNIQLGSNGIFWSSTEITGTMGCGSFVIGNNGVYFPGAQNVTQNGGCLQYNNVNFKTNATPAATGAKPQGAVKLEDMAERIDPTTGRVPDPLELPAATKNAWQTLAQAIKDTANNTDVGRGSSLPDVCIRLYKNADLNNYCDSRIGNRCSGNFINYLNQCYATLNDRESQAGYSGIKYLYYGGDNEDNTPTKRFLPIKLTIDGTPPNGVDGYFIWIFDPRPTAELKLPTTTENSAVLAYFPYGAQHFSATNQGQRHNYFIWSEGDINNASGSSTINGSIFMANGAKIGNLPDTELIFDQDVFDALIDAGVLAENSATGENPSDGSTDNQQLAGTTDKSYIPVSSRLSVSMESKSISTEKEPAANSNLPKSILVMPRIVRIAKNELSSGKALRDFYAYMYLNGAAASDSSAQVPRCEMSGGATLNAGSDNTEGLYECRFSNGTPPIPHSNFYVQVAGETGFPKVRINPSPNGTITEAEANGTTAENGCRNIVAGADDFEGNLLEFSITGVYTDWNVTIPEGNCTGSDKSWSCKIPEESDGSAILLLACPTYNGTATSFARFTLSNCNGCREHESQNTAIITRDIPKVTISRTSNSEVTECPASLISGNSWINVNCTSIDGVDIITPNQEWKCEIGSDATIAQGTLINGCELASGISPEGFNKLETDVNFSADLKWKTALVQVSGGNGIVYLNNGVEQITCNTSCEVHQGLEYHVSSVGESSAYSWSCANSGDNNSSTCQNTTQGINNILVPISENSYPATTLTPLGDDGNSTIITITLGTPPPAGLQNCTYTGGNKKVGQRIYPSEFGAPTPGGYGCTSENVGTFTYYINGATIASDGYEITTEGSKSLTVSADGCNGNLTTPISCGNVNVSNASEPSIACSLNKSLYRVGESITVSTTITNGTVKICGEPTVNGATTWNKNSGSPSGTMEQGANYTHSGSAPSEAQYADGTIYVSATCGEEPKSANCGAFEVEAAPAAATCVLPKTTVYMGENLQQPTITCTEGNFNDNPTFSGGKPNRDNNQMSNSFGGWYDSPGTKDPIVLTRVRCGNTWHENQSIPCGTVTVTAPTCSLADANSGSTAFDVGTNVNAPKVYCIDQTEARSDNRQYSGKTPDKDNYWGNSNTGKYTSASSASEIKIQQVYCNNHQLSNLNVDCGNITINAPEFSCKFADGSQAITVTQGQNITQPKIYKDGAEATGISDLSFGNNRPQQGNSVWGYYRTNDADGTKKTITASFKWNNITFTNVSCGTITVNKPTCTISGNYEVGAVIAPSYSCGDGVAVSGMELENYLNDNNKDKISFNSAQNGTHIYMQKIYCDGHELWKDNLGGRIDCGTVNITSPTITCIDLTRIVKKGEDPSNSDVAGITCSNGSTPTGISFVDFDKNSAGTDTQFKVRATCGAAGQLTSENCSGTSSIQVLDVVPTCADISETSANHGSSVSKPTVSCPSGYSIGDGTSMDWNNWNNYPAWDSAAAGIYNLQATNITCTHDQSSTQFTNLSADCGTLRVKHVLTKCDLGDITVNKGSTPSYEGKIECSGNDSYTVSNISLSDIDFNTPATYNNLNLNATCAGNNVTTSNLTRSCTGSITVQDPPAGTCEYQSGWCGGKDFTEVITNTSNSPNQGQCVFYSNLSGNWQASGSSTMIINGESKNNYDGFYSSFPAKKDDGYYMYLQVGSFAQQGGKTAGSPNCGSGGGTSSSSTTPSSSSGGGGGNCTSISSFGNLTAGCYIAAVSKTCNGVMNNCKMNGNSVNSWSNFSFTSGTEYNVEGTCDFSNCW